MAQLLFYEQGHVYEVDGVKLPSVSEIIRFLSREEYSDINQYTLDNAAERGTAIHKATEAIDKYGKVEIEDGYVPYLQAYIKFLKEHNVNWVDIEKSMYHKTNGYAGTVDRVGLVDDKLSLVDFKTNCVIHKTLVKAQLNGYEDMRKSNDMPPAEQLLCLQLMKDGKYRLYHCAMDMTEFDACLALHKALETKHTRGAID